jgi:hypothetical protein
MPLILMTYLRTDKRWSGGFQCSNTPSALIPASETRGATGTSRPSTWTSFSTGCDRTWYARKATLLYVSTPKRSYMSVTHQNRANTMHAVLSHPEDEYSTDSML